MPCLAITTPAPAATNAAVVEMLKVCAIATRASGIDWYRSWRRADKRCLVPHHAGTTRNLFNSLTLHAQANDKRRDLGWGSTAFHDLPHHRNGFSFGEITSLNDCLNTFSDHHLLPPQQGRLSYITPIMGVHTVL